MNIEKILVNTHYVWVDNDAEITPPCLVAELLSVGLYEMFQIDNLNDVDVKTQKRIVAADKELSVEGLLTYPEWLAEQELDNDLDMYESLISGDVSYRIGIGILKSLFIKGYQAAERELLVRPVGFSQSLWDKTKEEIIEQLKQGKR